MTECRQSFGGPRGIFFGGGVDVGLRRANGSARRRKIMTRRATLVLALVTGAALAGCVSASAQQGEGGLLRALNLSTEVTEPKDFVRQSRQPDRPSDHISTQTPDRPRRIFIAFGGCRPMFSSRSTRSRPRPELTAPTSSISAWATRTCRPQACLEKMIETIGKPRTDRYSASKGIPGLRRAQANYYERRFGVKLNPDTQVVATSARRKASPTWRRPSPRPGDVVLVPNPSYPIHAFGFLMAGGVIRSVPAEPTPEYFRALERAVIHSIPKPIALVTCYPSNPTADGRRASISTRISSPSPRSTS
jgi:DNA-binding transcriptional MocR family regulator